MKKLLPILCIVMAVMIVGISVFAFAPDTYSWFEPNTKEGIGLEFKDTTQLRAEDCTIQTFSGTYNNTEGTDGYGLVNYSNVATGSANITVNAGSTAYYKTVITNSSDKYDTVVSLFLPTFTVNNGNKGSIGVAYPTNSYRTFTSTQTDIHIIRNAHVTRYIETDANPGQLSVEWFVKCDEGSVTFNPASVYLMYS